ncbi:MAG TPA: flagellin [Candidatus Solibacter sp.]|nr:flagellin [Candidatus Solibacter sp.]
MAISLLNNISALEAQNQLQSTQSKLQNTLFQLSSGSRINSGADDAAGLAIANGLQANITALTQSSANANSGVGSLQVADGALAQITTLLNRAVTLATEAATGTVSTTQRQALDTEYQQINAEIASIGQSTNYNGTAVFTSNAQNVFLSDGVSNSTISTTTGSLTNATLGLAAGTTTVVTPQTLATGQITLGAQPAVGDQVTIGGSTYTFQSTVAAAGDVQIGATANATLVNLANAINDSGGTNGAGGTYDATAANASVTAVAPVGTTLTVSSLAASSAATANAVVLTIPTNTSGGISVSGSGTLSGGVDATSTPTAVTNTLLTAAGINPGANAQATLSLVNAAIADVASLRGVIGANINRLQAASNVESVQVQNLTAAEDQITAANIPQQVTNLSEFSILNQSGISALAQANSAQQSILKLLQ